LLFKNLNSRVPTKADADLKGWDFNLILIYLSADSAAETPITK
jgi:hypothetical protein